MVFETFEKELQKLLKERGFKEPTEPQKMGIPLIKKRKNVLILAPTGIGKTESVLLPLFDKWLKSNKKKKPVWVLYLTPLKSLNRDLMKRIFWWAERLDLEVSIRHGDTTQYQRRKQVEFPPHMFISTPEMLQAMLTGKRLRKILKNIEYVVVDECHEIVESKRGTQLSVALERLRMLTGGFKTIGLSATVGSPKKVADFLGADEVVNVFAVKSMELSVEHPEPRKKDVDLSEEVYTSPEVLARLRRIKKLADEHKSLLTFTNTRETTEVLSSRLRILDEDFKQEAHHSSLSKDARISSEKDFKDEKLKALVCTSSLELGIDIGSIDLTVQYSSPRQVNKLLQRAGRSGHKITETSKGVVLTSGIDDIFEAAVVARHALQGKLEETVIPEKPLDILAHQIVGLTFEEYGIPKEEVYKTLKRAYPYRNLTKKEFSEIVNFLDESRMIWTDQGVKKRRKAWNYYYSNLSSIPDTFSYRVIDATNKKQVARLDEEFVAEHCSVGSTFIVKGRTWQVLSTEKNRIYVEPVSNIDSAVPSWEGELMPVPLGVARGVGKLRRKIKDNWKREGFKKKLRKDYHLDDTSAEKMVEILKGQEIVPDHQTWLVEQHKDFTVVNACNGSLVNDTLGRYLSAKLSEKHGLSVGLRTDPYRIMLKYPGGAKEVVGLLKDGKDLENVLKENLERSSIFKWRFVHVAKRFGVLSRKTRYDRLNIEKFISVYRGTPVYREAMREVFFEKMDVENSKNILKKVKKGDIEVKTSKEISPLGKAGLTRRYSELMKPEEPTAEIYKAVEKRLLNTYVRLICLHCGKYNVIRQVKDLSVVMCPKCGARLIAATRRYDEQMGEVVKKKSEGKELSNAEKKVLKRAKKSADLVISHGKDAVFVLAGRGIGPRTGVRILDEMHDVDDRKKIVKRIYKGEKKFLRTKKFWKK